MQSGNQLLEVIIESLNRLQRRLQGETPAVRDLWDRMPNGSYRPVDENELSDYIKRHLDEDLRQRGVIVNREVEIRKGFTKGTGERTDIRVDAVASSGSSQLLDRLSVVIETKGRWHLQLMTAMDTQLVNRYLKEHGTTFGLYLVGWFDSPQWDPEHGGQGLAKKRVMQPTASKLEAQARQLSAGIVVRTFILNLELS